MTDLETCSEGESAVAAAGCHGLANQSQGEHRSVRIRIQCPEDRCSAGSDPTMGASDDGRPPSTAGPSSAGCASTVALLEVIQPLLTEAEPAQPE